jgi:hypothetical protein
MATTFSNSNSNRRQEGSPVLLLVERSFDRREMDRRFFLCLCFILHAQMRTALKKAKSAKEQSYAPGQ